MTDSYSPTRPIMGSAELARHKATAHGRDYTVSDDGYDDMEAAAKQGWRTLSSWGHDGWDLGNWPYVSIQVRNRDGRFELQSICEGDHTLYAFDADGDRDAALDYLFLWHAADKDWAPLNWDQRAQLDEGGFEVDAKFRGPCRFT